jgi:hypothetical protein
VLVPFCCAWLAAAVAGFALGRFKIFFFWPFLILAQNVLQIGIDFYTLWTWTLRSWGGPRFGSASNDDLKTSLTNEMSTSTTDLCWPLHLATSSHVLSEVGTDTSQQTTLSDKKKQDDFTVVRIQVEE